MNIRRQEIQDSLMTPSKGAFSKNSCSFSQHLEHMKVSGSQGSKTSTGQVRTLTKKIKRLRSGENLFKWKDFLFQYIIYLLCSLRPLFRDLFPIRLPGPFLWADLLCAGNRSGLLPLKGYLAWSFKDEVLLVKVCKSALPCSSSSEELCCGCWPGEERGVFLSAIPFSEWG